MEFTLLQQRLINTLQRDFPLVSNPFQVIAQQLSKEFEVNEREVFDALFDLKKAGVISRIGPVFDHKKAGASTLAAIAVPQERLDEVADIVNQFDEVNHNYERTHRFNLWFVVTSKDKDTLRNTIAEIEYQTGLSVLVLPMEAAYHIDLSFDIDFTEGGAAHKFISKAPELSSDGDNIKPMAREHIEPLPEFLQHQLRVLLQSGLPYTTTPYLDLAKTLKSSELRVINQIELWKQSGLIKRFGMVVKHRKLGYTANAMVVWNIPDDLVYGIAHQLADSKKVSLCYRRPRRLPDWPYNLFCMIHGKSRSQVIQQIHSITEQLGLSHIDKSILFSNKAYKQHGARYSNKKHAQV